MIHFFLFIYLFIYYRNVIFHKFRNFNARWCLGRPCNSSSEILPSLTHERSNCVAFPSVGYNGVIAILVQSYHFFINVLFFIFAYWGRFNIKKLSRDRLIFMKSQYTFFIFKRGPGAINLYVNTILPVQDNPPNYFLKRIAQMNTFWAALCSQLIFEYICTIFFI